MASDHREEVKNTMDELLLSIPGVSGGKAFGYPAYKVGRKVFCFVGGDGIAIKLPPDRVQALISNANMSIFEPNEGTQWQSWLSIDLKDPNAYADHRGLYEESVQFVGEG